MGANAGAPSARTCGHGRPHLAAYRGGLILGGAGLEQRAPHLRDRHRLGNEPGSEVAPAGEGAQLVPLGDVGEGRPTASWRLSAL
jgi:hypothetical protein